MKKAISIILTVVILLFSFTGCSNSAPISSKEWGYNYFPGTDWGMTKDEVFKALSLNESDFELTVEEASSHWTTRYIYTGKAEVFGETCDKVSFIFCTRPIYETQGLAEVQYILENVSKQEYEAICDNFDDIAKEQGIVATGNHIDHTPEDNELDFCTYNIKSESTTKNLPNNIKEKYDNYMKAAFGAGEFAEHIREKGLMADYINADLSTIKIEYRANDTESLVIVNFNGHTINTLKAALEAKY